MQIIYWLIAVLAALGVMDLIFVYVLFKFGFKQITPDDNIVSESGLYEFYKRNK